MANTITHQRALFGLFYEIDDTRPHSHLRAPPYYKPYYRLLTATRLVGQKRLIDQNEADLPHAMIIEAMVLALVFTAPQSGHRRCAAGTWTTR